MIIELSDLTSTHNAQAEIISYYIRLHTQTSLAKFQLIKILHHFSQVQVMKQWNQKTGELEDYWIQVMTLISPMNMKRNNFSVYALHSTHYTDPFHFKNRFSVNWSNYFLLYNSLKYKLLLQNCMYSHCLYNKNLVIEVKIKSKSAE